MISSSLTYSRTGSRMTVTYDSGTRWPNIVGGGLLGATLFFWLVVGLVLVSPKQTRVTCSRKLGVCETTQDLSKPIPLKEVKEARVNVSYKEHSTPPKPVGEKLVLALPSGDVTIAGESNPNGKRMRAFREAADALNRFLTDPSATSVNVTVPFAPDMSFGELFGGVIACVLGLVHFLGRSRSVAEFDTEAKTLHLHKERRWRGDVDTTVSLSDVSGVRVGGIYFKWVSLQSSVKPLLLFFGFATPTVKREAPKVADAVGELLGVPVTRR